MRAGISFAPDADRGRDLAQVALWRMRAAAEGDVNAGQFAERHDAPPKVVAILKSAVAPGTMSSASALSVVGAAVAGYLTSLRQDSIFFRLLADNMLVRVPMRTRATIATAMSGAGGAAYSEGDSRKLSSITVSNGLSGMSPIEVSTTIVATKELLDFANPAGADLIERELRAATAEAVDAKFLAIVAGTLGLAATSSGATLSACLLDLKFLLGRIDSSSRSRLAWIGSTSVAKALSVGIGEDASQFPAMSPQGGVLCGVPFFGTGGLSDGAPKLYLLDAQAIAADATSMDLQIAKHALLQMDTAPDSPETTSTTLVSLWQRDMVGLRVLTYIAAEVLRSASIVELRDIAWATSSPDSPA